MSERPCAVPNCRTHATEYRIDRRRRAPERLQLCLEHAAQFDRMTAPPAPPARPSSVVIDFDPDDTASSPFAVELERLEAQEAALLEKLRAVQIAIREIRRMGAA
jgi:hypothetical protein